MAISRQLAGLLALGLLVANIPSVGESFPRQESPLTPDEALAKWFDGIAEWYKWHTQNLSADTTWFERGAVRLENLFSPIGKALRATAAEQDRFTTGPDIDAFYYPKTAAAMGRLLAEPHGEAILEDFLTQDGSDSVKRNDVFLSLRLVPEHPVLTRAVGRYVHASAAPNPRMIEAISRIWRSGVGRSPYLDALGTILAIRFNLELIKGEHDDATSLIRAMQALGGREAQTALFLALVSLSDGSDRFYPSLISTALKSTTIDPDLLRDFVMGYQQMLHFDVGVEGVKIALSKLVEVNLARGVDRPYLPPDGRTEPVAPIVREMTSFPEADWPAVETMIMRVLPITIGMKGRVDLGLLSILEHVRPEQASSWKLLRRAAFDSEGHNANLELKSASFRVVLAHVSAGDNLKELQGIIRDGSLRSVRFADLICERAMQEIQELKSTPPAILGKAVLGQSRLGGEPVYAKLALELLNSPHRAITGRALEFAAQIFSRRADWEKLDADRRAGRSGKFVALELIGGQEIPELEYNFRRMTSEAETFGAAAGSDQAATKLAERGVGEVLSAEDRRREQEFLETATKEESEAYRIARRSDSVGKSIEKARRDR